MAKKQKTNKLPACKCCGKQWAKEDSEEFRYIDGIVACVGHRGVEQWYESVKKKMK